MLDILGAYHRRINADLDAFEQSGYRSTADASGTGSLSGKGFGGTPEIRVAVARLLEPDARTLRLPADVLAEAFLGMSLSSVLPSREPEPAPRWSAEQAVDLFLNGALSEPVRASAGR